MADAWPRQNNRDTDTKLKLDVRLPNIACEDKVATLRELEELEAQMRKSGISSWRQTWRYFEAALRGRAKIWVDTLVVDGIGLAMYDRIMIQGARGDEFDNIYLYCRRELMRRVGIQYEEPGDLAREAWESIVFPKWSSRPDYVEGEQ